MTRLFPLLALGAVLLGPGEPDVTAPLRLASRAPNGAPLQGASGAELDLSDDGQQLVFTSESDELVPDDDNTLTDVFVRNALGSVCRLSTGHDGTDSDGPSRHPALSGDGRWAAFTSFATNLEAAPQVSIWGDVFLRDMRTGELVCLSRGPGGQEGDGTSERPALSDDGTRVVFQSFADNLLPGDDNGFSDIFLWDATSGKLRLLSHGVDGSPARGHSTHPTISGDGRTVSFVSDAPNLVADDSNGRLDLFVLDLHGPDGDSTQTIERVALVGAPQAGRADVDPIFDSRTHAAAFPRSALSQDGRFVVFPSRATPHDHQQIVVLDRSTGRHEPVSATYRGAPADGRCDAPTISADGRFVGFLSEASNLHLADGDTLRDVFLKDRKTGALRLLSTRCWPRGTRSDALSVALAGRAGVAAFGSQGSDHVAGDTNSDLDVFLREL